MVLLFFLLTAVAGGFLWMVHKGIRQGLIARNLKVDGQDRWLTGADAASAGWRYVIIGSVGLAIEVAFIVIVVIGGAAT